MRESKENRRYIQMEKTRWEVKIGSPVMATDGEYGRLEQLILDPHQGRVFALIVRRLSSPVTFRTVVVPEDDVADATENEVRLKISWEQADALPEYKPESGTVVEGQKYATDDGVFAVRGTQGFEVGRSPGAQQPGMIENQITQDEINLALQLRPSHKVFCKDGHAGKVSLILLDPRGHVKGFVMHAGHLPGRNLIVPVRWVQEVDRENVHLSVEKSALESLPDYSSDYELAAEVEKALWADEILRETDYDQIDVKAEGGIVQLRGHVITSMNRTRAENAARSIHGVLGVENHLVVDKDLAIEVAEALGNDERTQLESISVVAQNGVIALNGQVGSAAIRQAAEEVAASVQKVRGVANYLQATAVVVDAEEQQVWQPPIDREVYATDMLIGHVESVIINPHNRRVTAFVFHGYYPEQLPTYENMQTERRVLVPIRTVRYETKSSVLLDISTIKAFQGRDFVPADFVSPPEDWQPPYPYHRRDVLFEM
jgi:osmotically-inducible protein OsmY/sporulation protein YlmC with PRC-barrel domain